MKRRGGAGPSAYGLGGLVPPAPAVPTGKFLGADGRWGTPASGVTQHSGLSSLLWTASGHTGTPGYLPRFATGTGAATYAVIGVDLLAYSAGLSSLSAVSTQAGLPRLTASGTWDNPGLGDLSVRSSAWQVTQAATRLLEKDSLYISTGIPTTSYGYAAGTYGSPTGQFYHGKKRYKRHLAANATSNTEIGGMSSSTETAVLACDADAAWECVVTIWGGALFGSGVQGFVCLIENSASPANTNDVGPVNAIKVRWRPAAGATFEAASTDGTPNTSTWTTLGFTPANDTGYAFKFVWNGTACLVSMATIDGTTGEIGTYGVVVTISTNLPSSALMLAPKHRWWNYNSPASAGRVDGGGATIAWK
jgi:hypothetical protein